MLFLSHFLMIIVSLLAIIYACVLFTQAIECLGEKLKLGNNAVGSILAVIGTGLPETIVPIIAIVGAYLFKGDIAVGKEVALGAIVGSPFMLSTFALFLLGVVVIFKKRDKKELNLDYKNILRMYKYFIVAYLTAVCAAFFQNQIFKILIVLFLITLYIVFVFRTILKSRCAYCEQEPRELFFCNLFGCRIKNEFFCIVFQLVVSLIALGVFSHFFVCEIRYFSNLLNISPLILSLIITPFATELPECINSIIWLKEDKDDLAVANVIGAVAFQAMIPFSIGILLTDWKFSPLIMLNVLLVVLCSTIFTVLMTLYKKIKLSFLLFCGVFYLIFIVCIFK